MTLHQGALVTHRAVLKEATGTAHLKAETAWTRDGKFADRAGYETWLRCLQVTHLTLGMTAASVIKCDAQCLEEHSRAKALALDLAGGPRPKTPPKRGSESWAYGVCYALNGSAIGASILLKSRSTHAPWPCAYLETMADYATSGRLKAFFERLEAVQLNMDDAVQGARDVFTTIAEPALILR